MKRILCSAILFLAANLSAQDFNVLEYARAAGIKAGNSARIPDAPAPAILRLKETMKEDYLSTRECWARPADTEADKAGLPGQFCLARIGVAVPRNNPDILDNRAYILIEETKGLRTIPITGYSKNSGNWTVIGSVFPASASLNGGVTRAFAAIYFTVSQKGIISAETPQIRGFITLSSLKTREIRYDIAVGKPF